MKLRKSQNIFIIGLLLILGGFVGISYLFNFVIVGAIISVVILLTFLIVFLAFNKKVEKECFCKKCHRQFDFDSGVTYEEISRKIVHFNYIENKSSHQIKERLDFKILFKCKCECGEETVFEKTIQGPRFYYDGTYEDENIEFYIEQYFRNPNGAREVPKKINVITYIIGVLAVAAAVLLGVAGESLGIIPANKGTDPKNYYNTYYGEYDFNYYTFKIGENTVEYTATNGMGITENETYEYDYVSASYASKNVSSPKYNDKDAILIYTTSNQKYAITLWVIENTPNNYTFECNDGGFKVTTTKEWVAGGVEVTSAFNGTYTYNSSNYLTLYSHSQSATLCTNGNSDDYKFIIGTPEYVNHWFKKSVNSNCVILFKDKSNESTIFTIVSSSTLILNDQYTFQK